MIDDELEGTTLGGYRVEALLGSGGMGSVYRGVQESLKRPVAIKVLRAELGQDAAIVARFRREAELAASLAHPNIAQVTDFGVEEGRAYLVMDLLEGEPLAETIESEGRLDEARTVRIAMQVLTALAMAHERGVVHRDLKPDNIFVQRVSGMDLVKLLDFGIARMLEPDEKMTGTGAVLGTPAYMSPEQARGKPVDARSDVFSVGCVLYEMLSGRRPFRGENYHELMFAVVEQDPQPLAEIDEKLSPALAKVIERAMSKDPEARFASAREMKDALEAIGGLREEAPALPRDASEKAFAETMPSEPERKAGPEKPEPAAKPESPEPEGKARRIPAWVWIVGGLAIGAAGWAAGQLGRDEAVVPPADLPAEHGEAMEPMSPDAGAAVTETETETETETATETEAETEAEAETETETETETEAETEAAAARRRGPRLERQVTCGSGHEQTVRLFRRRDTVRAVSAAAHGDVHAPRPDGLRPLLGAVNARADDLAACFRGHYMFNGQGVDVHVDAEGNTTSISVREYCPVDPPVVACLRSALAGVSMLNDGGGSGFYRFGLDHIRGP